MGKSVSMVARGALNGCVSYDALWSSINIVSIDEG